MAPHRILIADDHDIVRKGLCMILAARMDLAICGEAANGRDAIERARQLRPDLIIMDLTMPLLSGFAATHEIRKSLPDVPILIFSMHDGSQLMEESKRVGAQGFVTKHQAGSTLLEAVDALLAKKTYFPSESA